jgi:hypothetical protein
VLLAMTRAFINQNFTTIGEDVNPAGENEEL